MTSAEKKKQLMRYRNNELEIERIVQEIERWKSIAYSITPSYSCSFGSGGDNKMQSCIDKISELQSALIQQYQSRISLRYAIEQAIETVEDEGLKQLLKFRYIHAMSWERIAVKLNYDIDGKNVYKLHGKALTLLKLDTELHIYPVI